MIIIKLSGRMINEGSSLAWSNSLIWYNDEYNFYLMERNVIIKLYKWGTKDWLFWEEYEEWWKQWDIERVWTAILAHEKVLTWNLACLTTHGWHREIILNLFHSKTNIYAGVRTYAWDKHSNRDVNTTIVLITQYWKLSFYHPKPTVWQRMSFLPIPKSQWT